MRRNRSWPDTEEDQRRIPSGGYTLVEDVQHRTLFVNTHLQSCIFERNVTDQDTESDRDKEHRLEFIFNSQEDEQQTDKDHDKVTRCRVVDSCISEEQLQVFSQELEKAFMSVPAACNNTDPNIILSYYDEVSTFQYGIPFVYFYFNDFAVTGRR